MPKENKTTLYCFSPPVMLATFLIEVGLIVYTLWRYKLNTISKLVVAMLAFLAIFQMAEYMVCGGLGISGVSWAQVGFVAITLLPPLGIHLATEINGGKHHWLALTSYGTAAVFVSFFILVSSAVDRQVCGGNYIIFNMHSSIAWLYGLYYYGWLMVGVIYTWTQANHTKNKGVKRGLQTFTAGYALFMLPTTTVNVIDPSTIRGIPSIMCGFAVLFAFTIVFWTLPSVVAIKNKAKSIGRELQS